jgi:hypothetical protein
VHALGKGAVRGLRGEVEVGVLSFRVCVDSKVWWGACKVFVERCRRGRRMRRPLWPD